jgi:hypothetical protein
MAAPTTVTATGYFSVSRAGASLGDGIVRMQTASERVLRRHWRYISLAITRAARDGQRVTGRLRQLRFVRVAQKMIALSQPDSLCSRERK